VNFLLAIVVIVVIAKVLSELFERIGLVSLLGEFGAGLILGISGLALVHTSTVQQFAYMGVILLMFLAGYEETDIKFMLSTKRKLSFISLTGLITTLLVLFFFSKSYFGFTTVQSILFCFIFGLTDVAVGAKSLLATGKINTKIGESLLGIAVIDTVVGLVLLAASITLFTATSANEIAFTFGEIFLFFIITIIVAKYLPKFIHKTVRMRTEMMDVSVAFVSIFLLAYLAEELKLASVLGAYFAGLILQKAPDLETDHFSTTVKSISYGFFIPVFFAWIALSANIWAVSSYLISAIIITGIVILVKFGVIFIASLLQHASVNEALIYAVGMMAKGADNLVVLAIAVSLGVFSVAMEEMLVTSLVFVMLFSILLGSVLLKFLLRNVKNVE